MATKENILSKEEIEAIEWAKNQMKIDQTLRENAKKDIEKQNKARKIKLKNGN